MSRIVALIDGFNLYYAIDERREYHPFKWLNLQKLVQACVPKTDTIEEILYFTSLQLWLPEIAARHRLFIRANEHFGVKAVYGEFRQRDRTCPLCEGQYRGREEKQTDVNIAIHLLRLAVQDRYDTALVVTGDSDVLPAIRAVKGMYPTKRIRIAIPIGREANQLKQEADSYIRLKQMHLRSSMFGDEIDLGEGAKLVRPNTWR